jgi:hypothetical protein
VAVSTSAFRPAQPLLTSIAGLTLRARLACPAADGAGVSAARIPGMLPDGEHAIARMALAPTRNLRSRRCLTRQRAVTVIRLPRQKTGRNVPGYPSRYGCGRDQFKAEC